MFLRKFRIGSRLSIGFGLCIASAVLLLVMALVSQQLSAERQEAAGRQLADGLLAESALRTALLKSAVAIRNMGLESELTEVYKHQAVADQNRKEYLRILTEVSARESDAQAQGIVTTLQAIDAKAEKHYKEALGLLAAFSTDQAVKIIKEKIEPLLVQSDEQLMLLTALTKGRADAAILQAHAQTQQTRLLVVAIGSVALALVAGMAWAVTRSIVQPLRLATTATTEVAQGNLAFELDAQGNDEPAELIRGLETMRLALSSMVGEVRDSAQTVANAAVEISQANLDLSERTEQQASALQTTASTMSELESIGRNTASNSSQASESALSATSVATQGGAVVQQVVGTMRDIQASSARIGEIIGVIDGIAFQTNILALNAAVEAARAGEQGRGFAVVASEVRSLAGRSADAARQIKELISTSVERVDIGSQLVEQAGMTMSEIVAAIRKVSEIAAEISAATSEQSLGVSEVGRTVSQMDVATQQNAALVEQGAAAADSLRGQAERLVASVSRFSL